MRLRASRRHRFSCPKARNLFTIFDLVFQRTKFEVRPSECDEKCASSSIHQTPNNTNMESRVTTTLSLPKGSRSLFSISVSHPILALSNLIRELATKGWNLDAFTVWGYMILQSLLNGTVASLLRAHLVSCTVACYSHSPWSLSTVALCGLAPGFLCK